MDGRTLGLWLSGAAVTIGVIIMLVINWDKFSWMAKRMIVLATFVVIVLTTFALRADAQECTVLTIEDEWVVGRVDAPGIAADLVGPHINVNFGDTWEGAEGWEGFIGETSFEIPAVDVTATICPDGTASYVVPEVVTPAPERDPETLEDLTPDEMTVDVVVDIEPVEVRFVASYGLSFPVG